MYQPLAAAVIAAMVAALVLAVTLVPIAAAVILRPSRSGADEDVVLLRKVKQWYAPALDRCLRHPKTRCSRDAAGCRARASRSDFGLAATSCRNWTKGRSCCRPCCRRRPRSTKSTGSNHRVEDILRGVPEVEDVVRRTGRAERTEDPMPHTVSDVLVVLKPERTRSLEEIEADMREQLERAAWHRGAVHDAARDAHRRRARRDAGRHLRADLRPGPGRALATLPNRPRRSSEASTGSPTSVRSSSRDCHSFRSR